MAGLEITRDDGRPTPLAWIASTLLFAATTITLWLAHGSLEVGHVVLIYAVLVNIVAFLMGTGPALVTTALSVVVLAFYFPGLLNPHDPTVSPVTDWPLTLMFVIVSVTIAVQTGRLRAQQRQASSDARLARLLSELSMQTTLPVIEPETRLHLAADLAQAIHASRVLFFVDENGAGLQERSGSVTDDVIDQRLVTHVVDALGRWRALVADPQRATVPVWERVAGTVWVLVPMLSVDAVEGVVVVEYERADDISAAHLEQVIVPAANMIALRIDSDRLNRELMSEEAAREADAVRATLVSSVSHELKTPLAGMKAVVSSLLAGDVDPTQERVHAALVAIETGLLRLESSIGALMEITRLRSMDWRPVMGECELADVVGPALDRLPASARQRIVLELPEGVSSIRCDEAQISRALLHLLENALAYSPQDSLVTVGASDGESFRLWVQDKGPGIPDAEKPLVTKGFFRGAAAGTLGSGTGLGLTIVDEIVRFNGGRLELTDAPSGGTRATMVLQRPSPHHTKPAIEE